MRSFFKGGSSASGVLGGSTRIAGLGPGVKSAAPIILSSGTARALSGGGTLRLGGAIAPAPPNGVAGIPGAAAAGVGGSLAASSGDLGCTTEGSGSTTGCRCFGIATNLVPITPLP